MAIDQPAGGGCENRSRVPGRTIAELAAQHDEKVDQERDAHERHRQTWSPVGAEAGFEPGRGHPIQKRRLLEPGLAPQARRDPIACSGHGSTNGRVARLVGSEKTSSCESKEVEEKKADDGQNRSSASHSGLGCDSATNSAGSPRPPTAITIYCLPFAR